MGALICIPYPHNRITETPRPQPRPHRQNHNRTLTHPDSPTQQRSQSTMLSRTLVRRGGSGSPARALLRHYHQTPALASSPGRPATVVDGGFWRSLIPKPMRRESQGRRGKKSSSWLSTDGQWNPATFYIVIFLLIGSMSIQMIALRNSFQSYMRRSEVRIGLLRDVVERIQRGETVNVEKALGTGNAEKEADWEEGMFDHNP